MLATERFRGITCSVQPAMERLILIGFSIPLAVSVFAFGFTAHIRSRSEEAREIQEQAGARARRWVDFPPTSMNTNPSHR